MTDSEADDGAELDEKWAEGDVYERDDGGLRFEGHVLGVKGDLTIYLDQKDDGAYRVKTITGPRGAHMGDIPDLITKHVEMALVDANYPIDTRRAHRDYGVEPEA